MSDINAIIEVLTGDAAPGDVHDQIANLGILMRALGAGLPQRTNNIAIMGERLHSLARRYGICPRCAVDLETVEAPVQTGPAPFGFGTVTERKTVTRCPECGWNGIR